MQTFRIPRRLALAVALSLLAAACGVDDPDGAAAPTDTEQDDVEVTPDASDAQIEDGTASEIYAQLAELDPDAREALILERANEEGRVTLYQALPVEWGEQWQQRFTEAYPEIEMEFVRGSHSDLLERYPAEERSGNHTADVLLPGGANVAHFHNAGLLADLHGVPVPSYYDDEFIGQAWVTAAETPFVIAWNTNLVDPEDAPRNHQDLLDPRWEGQVAIEAAPEQWIVQLLHVWGYDETEEYLRQLVVENDAPIREGHTNLMQLLAAGEFPIASELIAHHVEGLIAEGAPLDWTAGDTTPSQTLDMAISEDAPNPYAAALLMNFILSDEGVAVFYEEGRAVTHPDAEFKYPRIAELVASDSIARSEPAEQADLVDQAQQLIEEILTPRFVD